VTGAFTSRVSRRRDGVFLDLLLEDTHSFLRQNPLWEPFDQFRQPDGTFGMAELIRAAQA
jgi:hypothetical protein